MKRQSLFIRYLIIGIIGLAGCGKTDQIDIANARVTYDPAAWAACTDNIDADYVKPGVTNIIPYHISSKMYDSNNNLVCTPRAIREKIKKIFDLYASIPEADFAFTYAGEDTATYLDNCSNVPQDTDIHINLNCGLVLGKAQGGMIGPWGPAHTRANSSAFNAAIFPGGYAHFPGPSYLNEVTLIHEIGHTLGLDHIPLRGANMSYYGGYLSDNGGEYFGFTEQERADLIGISPTASAKVYRISGTVVSDLSAQCGDAITYHDAAQQGGLVDVLAVNTVNGRTYGGLALCGAANGAMKFYINVLAAGTYRLVAIPNTYVLSLDPSQVSASWYVDNTTSTNNPVTGTVITLNDGSPSSSGVVIQMPNSGASPQPFVLDPMKLQADTSTYTSTGSSAPLTFSPMHLSPGESGVFDFALICSNNTGVAHAGVAHCNAITGLSAYGTSPDYSFSNLTPILSTATFKSFRVTVTANANAAPGFRLAVGTAVAGNTVVGVMGIHILNGAKKPGSLTTSFSDQMLGIFDFTSLNPLYWQ